MNDLTPKQEMFCQKYIQTGNACEAYRQAYDAENMGPDSIKVEASRLLDNPNVSLAISGYQAAIRARHSVTIESITDELEEARQLALRTEQPAPAVSASMGKAKLYGLGTENVKYSGTIALTGILEELDGQSADLPSHPG